MKRSSLFLTAAVLAAILILGLFAWNFGRDVYAVDRPINGHPQDCLQEVRFAVIGDYGDAGPPAAQVAALVDSWQVDFIVTAGDNNYDDGAAETIDANIGQYYQAYIHPYQGGYGPGSEVNRFYPALGNHDWNSGNIDPYLAYFRLPGNERYYEFEQGPVHFFILDSDEREPDGHTADSQQARWLQEKMAASSAPWRLVILHHPPFTSSLWRGDNPAAQWPYTAWGASATIAGHEHYYERLQVEGIPQFVNGLGGRAKINRFGWPSAGSEVRYNQDHGAMLVTADPACINYAFFNINGTLIDSLTIRQ